MAKQVINIGTSANDGTGDTLRNAFDKTNDNFDELYTDKEDKSNKSTNTSLGTSDTLYPTQNAVKTYVDTQISNVSFPYKIYRALVSQSGTDAPTAIVLENTFGQVPVYGYNLTGSYSLTFTGNVLTDNKTLPSEIAGRTSFITLVDSASGIGGSTGYYTYTKSTTNEISIYSFDSTSNTKEDNILQASLIEIIVYN